MRILNILLSILPLSWVGMPMLQFARYRQNELKEGAQRSVGKQYYYIDYEYFCNVVKWRIAKMRHIIDSTLRNVCS